MKNQIVLFLKGLLMGTCDLIPGISGGTIAFITGIYSKLINSIKNISVKAFLDAVQYLKKRTPENKQKIEEDFKNIDFYFLINLGAGIITAFLLGSRIISFILDNYFTYTIAFFSGLIVASSKIIFDHINNHKTKNILFGVLGLFLGASFALLIPVNVNPSYAYVFLGGFLGVSAMFLPGISGAFVLLVLGLYEFMLKKVLRDIPGHLDYFIASVAGALLGMFFISRVISFLFDRDKCKTLYVLLGLVLGSLIVPAKRIYQETPVWNTETIALLLLLFALGIISVIIVNKQQAFKQE